MEKRWKRELVEKLYNKNNNMYMFKYHTTNVKNMQFKTLLQSVSRTFVTMFA